MSVATVYTVGSLARIKLDVYDVDGALADSTAVSATLTKPDGTTADQDIVRESLGVYYFDYTIEMPGRHTVYWLTAGFNTGATTDAFDAQSAVPVATVAELKRHLNIDEYQDDTELLMFLDYATAMIEARVGRLTTRTVTTTVSGDGSSELALDEWPIASVTSVTENGATLPATAYGIHQRYSNTLVRRFGTYYQGNWWQGFSNIVVTYVAGWTDVPPNYRLAVLELTRHLWQTQRGAMNRPRSGDDYQPGLSFSMPNRVLELLDDGLPGIA